VEIARGAVDDRPWGLTLGAAVRHGRCQLTLISDSNATHQVAFDGGAVVAATSPLVADSAIRIASTGHFIIASQIKAITQQVAELRNHDAVDRIAELARLNPTQTAQLLQRMIAQRAARTFAIDRGRFVIDDQITLPVRPSAVVDARAVMYSGLRLFLSEERLSRDLEALGSRFVLRPAVVETIRYGFTQADRPIIDALRAGTTVYDLEAMHPELDPRAVHAVIYALVACNECETLHDASPPVVRRSVGAVPSVDDRPRQPVGPVRVTTREPTPPDPFSLPRIATGTAPPSRTIPPPVHRTLRGSAPPVPPPPTKAELSTEARLALASTAFRRGLALLREDRIAGAIEELTNAVQLAPEDDDHHAALAWAQFCGARDRSSVADSVRKVLERTIRKSRKPNHARFYLGRVERMLGRDREALQHFHDLLDEEPRHADARAEVRAIEARMAMRRK